MRQVSLIHSIVSTCNAGFMIPCLILPCTFEVKSSDNGKMSKASLFAKFCWEQLSFRILRNSFSFGIALFFLSSILPVIGIWGVVVWYWGSVLFSDRPEVFPRSVVSGETHGLSHDMPTVLRGSFFSGVIQFWAGWFSEDGPELFRYSGVVGVIFRPSVLSAG